MIDAEKILGENADSEYREFNNRIVPGYNGKYGVRTPVIRDIVKRICKDDWRSFLAVEETCPEFVMLKLLVIANAPMDTDERLGLSAEYLHKIDNWAFCDLFCSDWKIKKKDRDVVWNYFSDLIRGNDEFVMRIGAVFMMAHYLDEEHIDAVLDLLTENYHPGYYYVMGCAWALSSCFIKFPEKTEPYLFDTNLDSEIRDKTFRKIYDSFRVTKEEKDRLKAKKLSTFPKSGRK